MQEQPEQDNVQKRHHSEPAVECAAGLIRRCPDLGMLQCVLTVNDTHLFVSRSPSPNTSAGITNTGILTTTQRNSSNLGKCVCVSSDESEYNQCLPLSPLVKRDSQKTHLSCLSQSGLAEGHMKVVFMREFEHVLKDWNLKQKRKEKRVCC